MDTISVLVVEADEEPGEILNCLKAQFSERNRIKTAESLEAALTLQNHYSFDIIIVNPDLADAHGLETIRRLMAAAPDMAIIVISDHRGDEQLAIKSVRYGAQDYIEKQQLSPFSLGKSIIYAMERKNILQQKKDLLADLTDTLKKIEALQSILPLCASCQKIYHEADSLWLDVHSYLQKTRSRPTQTLCPDCRETFEITF